MQDDFNPYAAPTSSTMHPRAAEWLRSTDPSLQTVANGLGRICNGIILIIASLILGFILALVVGAAVGPRAAMLVGMIVIVFALIGLAMVVIGTLMCLATPAETGARGLIIASVILEVTGFAMLVIDYFVPNIAIDTIGTLALLAGHITFLLFLKQLSEFIGAVPLAERAKLLLVLVAVTIGLRLALLFVAPALVLLLALAMLVIELISLFMYLRLLEGLRKAIQSGGAVY
jgi:hypothetical protein